MATRKPDNVVLQALHRRVLFVFDFDETLAPNTTNALLNHLGEEPETFRTDHVEPLVADGWEQRLAEARALVDLSNRRIASGEDGISADTFAAVAAELPLYDGVEDMFDLVVSAVEEIDDDIDVEFHLVNAGFVNVPSETAIADRFDTLIGGHWAFADDGSIASPKNTVGHYAKVRHLKALAKGLSSIESDDDHDVDAPIPAGEWHVPYEQIVFVGDGDSDLPAFDFMQDQGGTAVAVHQSAADEGWESREDMREGRQVMALARSDFSNGSPLLEILCAAGRRAAWRIRILELGRSGH